jgi:Ca2+-binding RTX toxin-like protein
VVADGAYPGPLTRKCAGANYTQIGTSGNDVLIGTSGHDVIEGLDGNDRIKGLGEWTSSVVRMATTS